MYIYQTYVKQSIFQNYSSFPSVKKSLEIFQKLVKTLKKQYQLLETLSIGFIENITSTSCLVLTAWWFSNWFVEQSLMSCEALLIYLHKTDIGCRHAVGERTGVQDDIRQCTEASQKQRVGAINPCVHHINRQHSRQPGINRS